MAKKEPPMKEDSLNVFSDPSDTHKRVVRALQSKGFTSAQISKATGLPESDVKKLMG